MDEHDARADLATGPVPLRRLGQARPARARAARRRTGWRDRWRRAPPGRSGDPSGVGSPLHHLGVDRSRSTAPGARIARRPALRRSSRVAPDRPARRWTAPGRRREPAAEPSGRWRGSAGRPGRAAGRSAVARRVGSGSATSSNDRRPPAAWHRCRRPTACRSRPNAAVRSAVATAASGAAPAWCPGAWPGGGPSRARSGASVSLVTNPAQTSSQSASTTSACRRRRLLPRCAPHPMHRSRGRARTGRPRAPARPAAGVDLGQHEIARRGRQVADGLGGQQRHPAVGAGAEPPPTQTTSPALVSSSSRAGE